MFLITQVLLSFFRDVDGQLNNYVKSKAIEDRSFYI